MSELKIAFVGDVMCGDSFYVMGHGVAASIDKYGTDFLSNEIIECLRAHDIVFCNLECVLSDIGNSTSSLRRQHMRGRPQTAQYLAKWGINVANVANNHILEQGWQCAIDTVKQLHKAGIKTVGAGNNGLFQPGVQITEMTLNKQTLSVMGVCVCQEKYAYYGGATLDEIIEATGRLTSQGKIVIISIHWGDELIDRPSLDQRRTARRLLEAGAKLIVGHHPHVVQGIENIEGRLIAYSLGNFIFDCFLNQTQLSIILSVTISEGEIIRWDYLPVEKDKEHRPQFVEESRKVELKKEMERRCKLLQLKIPQKQYDRQYKYDLNTSESIARYKLWLELVKRMPNLKFIYWPQFFFRPIQRRLGIW